MQSDPIDTQHSVVLTSLGHQFIDNLLQLVDLLIEVGKVLALDVAELVQLPDIFLEVVHLHLVQPGIQPCRLGSVPTEFLDLAARLVPQPSPGSTICSGPTGPVQFLVNLVQKPLDTIQKLSGSGKIRWRHSGGNLAAQNQPAR